MDEHPCQQHRPGPHSDACRSGYGYCGSGQRTTALAECRACRQLVCPACTTGYLPELGPLCGPCTPPAPRDGAAGEGERDLVRMCVFDLDLSCGHVATVALTGWYPVTVACCDRLGGTFFGGGYVAFAADVEYVRVLSERYEYRPTGTPPAATRVLGRRPRTDEPSQPDTRWHRRASSGRFPARVGASRSDATPDTRIAPASTGQWAGAPARSRSAAAMPRDATHQSDPSSRREFAMPVESSGSTPRDRRCQAAESTRGDQPGTVDQLGIGARPAGGRAVAVRVWPARVEGGRA